VVKLAELRSKPRFQLVVDALASSRAFVAFLAGHWFCMKERSKESTRVAAWIGYREPIYGLLTKD
jgi:hypothetical protein